MADGESEIGWAQLGLGSVLKQNQLVVPPNQREYAWENKEVKTLLNDFSREIGEGERKYFLGTIVTIPRAGNILEVVDGQQRLATTAIILSCIRDYIRKSEPELANSIDSDFLTKYNRSQRAYISRIKMNVDDNDYFRSRLSGEKPLPEPTKPSHKLINEAFIEAEKHVKAIVAGFDHKEHGNVLNRWLDFIELRATIILLRVPNAANAYRMFETLNDRGKRTSQSDLVKNYLFGCAGERIDEVQQRWAFMRGALESMERDDTTIEFLKHSLSAIRGFVREADVYEAVQNHAKGEQPVVTFAGQLEALANVYVAIHNQEHERWNKLTDSTRRALEVIVIFDLNVMKSMILSISYKFSDRDLASALIFCVSLAVRLMICGKTRTGSVEEGLANASQKIFDGQINTTKDLISQLKSIAPTDGVFRQAFELATVSNNKLARYYLRSLEMQAKGESEPWHIPNDDRTIINLEHVLPDKPEDNWPQFSDDEVRLYRNRIGNLALLRASENSGLKSIGFQMKRAIFANCPYILTNQIADATQWTSDEISKRQKTLAELALQTWPI